ncbi:zinc finger family protein [Musa troglodytarum]|uniref:Zinc finger family protein n=1 Tax=Musa troglodytarum TaxID=320322 RepID=A0A9E7JQG4_9LILI|nr:zinc finger family protein [Musa troglodytarum]
MVQNDTYVGPVRHVPPRRIILAWFGGRTRVRAARSTDPPPSYLFRLLLFLHLPDIFSWPRRPSPPPPLPTEERRRAPWSGYELRWAIDGGGIWMLMAVPSVELHSEGETDRHPLLMDRATPSNGHEHIVDIPRGINGDENNLLGELHNLDRNSTSATAQVSQTSPESPDAANSGNATLTGRSDNYGRRNRSPLNSGLWISVELIVNASQIIAAIIVLSLSRKEHPRAPLFEWIIGYTVGCFANLPHLYWRYIRRNSSIQEPARSNQSTIHNNPPESSGYTTSPVTQASEQENDNAIVAAAQVRQNRAIANPRINALVDHFKMALDCFFAVWFVVGNVWIFGGRASSEDAPNLYRLCIVFLTFSCIGYAMPFILCAIICCCLPCIISILGFREDMGHDRGATSELINALPTYKFKSKWRCIKDESGSNSDGQSDGGILAPGTDKERIVSAEDAVCCICLAKYVDNEELRELPCSHFFHKDCVDKWLKINALCPLCKSEAHPISSSILAAKWEKSTSYFDQ